MKSGQLSNKLRTKHPTLSMMPPAFGREAAALADLEKVRAITEAPAREAIAALEAAGEGAAIEGAVEAAAAVPEVVSEAPKPEKKVKVKGEFPWEGENAPTGVVAVTFRLPARLASQLRYLGGSIYGSTINSIAVEAIDHRVDKLLKERLKDRASA